MGDPGPPGNGSTADPAIAAGRHRGHAGAGAAAGTEGRRAGAGPDGPARLRTVDEADQRLTELGAGVALTELLSGFIVELRTAGLPVSLTENLDAMAAVQHIPLDDRDAFKYALGATLVKNASHWRVFETVFEVYFSLRGREYALTDEQAEAMADLDDLLGEMQSDQQGEQQGAGGTGESMTPEELAEMLMRALSQGN
jgi:uncharacterized protein with von Willebrand factor type A (vWA) domain